MKKAIIAALSSGFLASCAVGPNYVRPQAAPAQTGPFVSSASGVTAEAEPETEWWRIYDDPALNELVANALAANTDLRVATANLKAAEAVLSETRNARLPQTTTNASANYGKYQPPLNLPGDRFTYGGGVQLSYEADLFGRVSRSIEAARADADALAFARAAVQVRIVAATTDAYLAACTAAESVEVIKSSITLTSDSARIIGLQRSAGSAAELDVARAEQQVAEARAELKPAENSRSTALFELAALLGLPPSQVPEAAARCGSAPGPHRPIAIGDGASLLRRRPDVAQAERQLAAATARIGVATADLYPRISIGGGVAQYGGEGISSSQGFTYGVGPALSFSFPNIGAARAKIRQADARLEAALATFDGVVLTALKEAEQAVSSYAAALDRQKELVAAEGKAEQAFRLADLRYKAGSIAYIDVIVAQSELVRTRLLHTQADRELASARIGIFRALGSGWEAPVATASGDTAAPFGS